MTITKTTVADDSAPLFKAFEWLPPRAQFGPYHMLSNVRDLAAGSALVLELVERSQLDLERGDAPIISTADALCLTRMSLAAMKVITDSVDSHFDHIEKYGAVMERPAGDRGDAR